MYGIMTPQLVSSGEKESQMLITEASWLCNYDICDSVINIWVSFSPDDTSCGVISHIFWLRYPSIESILFDGILHRHYLCYEIYDFDSNLWRTLDVGTPHWAITSHSDAVSLNGNTYWLALDREQRYDIDNRLICFDYTSETFGPILRLPLPFQDQEQEFGDVFVALSCLLPKQGKLAVMVEIEHPFELAIWVTTMIDPNNVSWTKFLTVDTTVNDIRFSSMGFFIDEDKKLAMIFDDYRDTRYTVDIVGAGFYRRSYVDLLVNRFHFRDRFLARSYVPSLVQIKKPPSRKRRTKFQLRPCDQNSAKRTRRRRT